MRHLLTLWCWVTGILWWATYGVFFGALFFSAPIPPYVVRFVQLFQGVQPWELLMFWLISVVGWMGAIYILLGVLSIPLVLLYAGIEILYYEIRAIWRGD